MTDPMLTEGMRHAAEEDDNSGNHLQANYLRTGADEIDRLCAELAGSGRMRKPIKVVEQGPRTVAPQWALFKGMDIAHHFIPEAEFRKRAELATYIAESLYWCAQPLQGGPPQEPLIVEITGLRAELAARDERIAGLEAALVTCDGALEAAYETIDLTARINNPSKYREPAPGSVRLTITAARSAAKAARDE